MVDFGVQPQARAGLLHSIGARKPAKLATLGASVDHVNSHQVFPHIAAQTQSRSPPAAISRRANETRISRRSRWAFLCRAIGQDGRTLDFRLSGHRVLPAAGRVSEAE